MLASSPDRGRRPQVRGGSFPDPASAPEGPSGIRFSGLKPSQISHRRVFALRHTSVLNTPENLNSAIPDAKERCSQAPAFPFGCFQYSAPACGAVAWEVRGSQAPPEHRSGPLPSKVWAGVRRLAGLSPENSRKKSIYRSKAAERLNRAAECTGAHSAGDQEPANHHAAP